MAALIKAAIFYSLSAENKKSGFCIVSSGLSPVYALVKACILCILTEYPYPFYIFSLLKLYIKMGEKLYWIGQVNSGLIFNYGLYPQNL
jgi:hypothetical protein